jgi:hypothetical protein
MRETLQAIYDVGGLNWFLWLDGFVVHILMKYGKGIVEYQGFTHGAFIKKNILPYFIGFLCAFVIEIVVGQTLMSETVVTVSSEKIVSVAMMIVSPFIGYSNSSLWYNFIKGGKAIFELRFPAKNSKKSDT